MGYVSPGVNHSWRFTFTIPTHSQASHTGRMAGDVFKLKGMYTSNDGAFTHHRIPSTFNLTASRYDETFVEYFLLAELGTRERSKFQSTLPLNVRAQSLQNNITDWRVEDWKPIPELIRTPQVLRENEGRELSFREKSRVLFHRSRVPRYGFTVCFSHPTVIQLEHPSPMPFKIYVEPKFGDSDSCTNFCADGDISSLPRTIFMSMKLKLRCKTKIRGATSEGTHEDYEKDTFDFEVDAIKREAVVPILKVWGLPPQEKDSSKPTSNPSRNSLNPDWAPKNVSQQSVSSGEGVTSNPSEKSDLPSEKASITSRQPESLPSYNNAATGSQTSGKQSNLDDESEPSTMALPRYSTLPPRGKGKDTLPTNNKEPLHLGEHLSLTTSIIRELHPHPTFFTYNIAHAYKMQYKIYMRTADKKHDIEGEVPVTLLAASEDFHSTVRRGRVNREGGREEDVKEWMRATCTGDPDRFPKSTSSKLMEDLVNLFEMDDEVGSSSYGKKL